MFRKVNVKYNVRRKRDTGNNSINTKTVLNSNDNTLDENGNDKSGISAKVVTNVLSVEDRVIEEEEFKKKTKLDISKESLKQNVKDGDTNTYTLNILNVGDNPARIVKIEETIDGNAKIKKDSVRILNSKGEDVTNNTNINLNVEGMDYATNTTITKGKSTGTGNTTSQSTSSIYNIDTLEKVYTFKQRMFDELDVLLFSQFF